MAQLTGLWLHRDFLKLWSAQSISVVGSAIGSLAISLTAALAFQATPVEMGILQALSWMPSLLALFAGVWADRWPRRAILIGADFGRAVLLLAIPLAVAVGLRRIEILCVVAALVGVLSIFFDVAYQSYLPSVVQRENLVEANSKLTMSASAAAIAGPGLAGGLVQLITAPVAIIADASSFIVSGLLLGLIRSPEMVRSGANERRNIWREIGEGLRVVTGNPILRAIAAYNCTASIFWSIQLAVFVLYMTRDLKIEAVFLGLIYASINAGTLIAPLVANQFVRWFGLGPTIIGAPMVSYIGAALFPLAQGQATMAVHLLVVGQFLIGFGLIVFQINQVSLRVAITPDHLLGRMSASMRFLSWMFTPLGALLGGILGQAIGLQATLTVAAIGLWLAVPWALFSPLRTLKSVPAAASSAQ